MGKYDDVSRRLITHIDEAFPMRCFNVPRDWEKIDEILSKIPYKCERLLTIREIKYFYE